MWAALAAKRHRLIALGETAAVLGLIWLVLSVLWIGGSYLSVAGYIGEPGYMIWIFRQRRSGL
jgi:hypothetical protein